MNTPLREVFNSYLDKLVRPEVPILRKPWSAFQACGFAGLALAILLSMTLVAYLNLSPWVMTAIMVVSVLALFAMAMATKILTGEERLIYFHHQIAVMAIIAVLLWFLHQPILSYLDVTILGIGLFLACGRIGCLMVGCCHGRPHRWGVCYREGHAAAGFTSYFVGVRLFPIQAIESLWVFCIVVVGSGFVLSGRPQGDGLAWYVITYGVGRFCFEFMRGDPERPYLWGFSQSQWVALFLMGAVVWAELYGVIAFSLWHAGATLCLVFAMVTVALRRLFRRTPKHQLLHPRHIKEVAEAVKLVPNVTTQMAAILRCNSVPAGIPIVRTSLGIQISASRIQSAIGYIYHYALSHQHETMNEETAKIVWRLILQLKHPSSLNEVIKGNRGVFHLLVPIQREISNTTM